ncbi:Predicted 5' DNA nuclease, flap endonuclease-1-like, helix-3-turn-helix (H3TH) domain [Mesorhizobium albiziae]|uniref:Predicted 5' DNA nuclease, flap endonuclease-1-like, helix-3-turn-helix (H3TH) domain n=1 Tax=Neomesorhizobium albiziae TaxID=335020 RepID=A0A1I3UW08_9HYPH|nr:NADH-ubiquinone dehydrogenase [Mesorhizobium albiziae]GLS28506.1 NADH-ubiquinone dehydrogenase subunit [Mesorhizobium albiziae]SFJ87110.1 Predicted 5' DNA nuclease, flap endonuclease-1-like, helix-3-turn-helix (H3TH) domain [Mesorhizobium albiziae]
MSIFPTPDELLPDLKKLEAMNKEISALMPKEFTGAVNLMVHPVASVAAVSALGLGVASQVFGVWMGTVAGAVEVSQRMFQPFLDEATADDFRDRTKTPAKRARDAADTLIAEAKTVTRDAVETVAKAAEASVSDVEKAGTPEVVAKVDAPEVAAKPVKEPKIPAAPIAKSVSQAPQTIEKIAEEPAAQVSVEAAADLMPEDFRQPQAVEKPRKPDDLKLISGVGPKLETVLNGLGIWTYGQVAALSREETAWLDDYLGFKGRIGRDGWIEQATALAKTTKRAGKPAKNVH